ncbi:autotransporter secretion inner membrane protein TamB [Roseivivax lentus]|uniref:Autotransporter secretion inner membrane protein TamB n=1 Tax=Roseivivax lentus TaxID=633194 RepID=A0A1N7KDL7_9RHOB|nr:translocation/assembly module TamB domain-containing protein [Roseivivax lentus]SIS59652.1 autotransporter secretion inner membrane protein TamB [Roseivivax lentus]
MRHLTTALLTAGVWIAGPSVTLAQERDDSERGRLEALIEDNLSGEGFQVDVVGFEGALSSEATLQSLTIADADGVWLTLNGVVLDWNRAALLRGRVSVNQLVADEILVPRLPGGSGEETTELPDAEARPFSLPELPVSVQIGRIAAERVVLGAPLLGEEAVVKLEGSASLEGGEGEVDIAIDRIDRGGSLSLVGSFLNETGVLSLDLSLEEPAGGITAKLINLPGEPPVAASIAGEGPLSDFTADILLATDGEDRITGQVEVRALEGAQEGTGFRAQIAGDIRPLLAPENREFFGDNLSLDVAGQSLATGALTIDTLALDSEAIKLNGDLALGPDKWPERIRLTGSIDGPEGSPIQLPIPGPVTRMDSANLNVRYDASQGDGWTAELSVVDFDQPTLSADQFRIDGAGTLIRGTGNAIGRIDGRLDITSDALAFADPALAEAVGTTLNGLLAFAFQEGEALRLTEIDLDGAGVAIDGALQIGGLTDNLNLAIDGDLQIATDDIARFSALAGRPLSGGADARVSGRVEPLSGAFDAEITGTVRDLVTGIAEADRLLDGATELALSARRDGAGILLRSLTVDAPEAQLSASGRLGGQTGNAEIDLSLAEISEILPELTGALDFSGTARNDGDAWQVAGDISGPGGTRAVIDAALQLLEGQLQAVGGTLTADVADLSVYSGVARRSLGGAVSLTAEGSADLTLATARIAASGALTDPVTGIAEADRLLAGRTTFTLDGAKTEEGYLLRLLDVVGARLSVDASGRYLEDDSGAEFDIRLSDLGDVVSSMSGGARVTGTASQSGEDWDITLDASGPGGLTADVDAVAVVQEMMPQSVSGDVALAVNTLGAYAGLIGRPLSGSVDATASGAYDLTTGAADITLDAEAAALSSGIAAVDQLLRGGVTDLRFRGGRTGAGILVIEEFNLDTPQLDAQASGSYSSDGSQIVYAARLADVGLFVPEFNGPATVEGNAVGTGDDWRVDASLTAVGGAQARVQGTVAGDGSTLALDAAGSAPLGLANPFLEPNLIGGTANFDLSVNGAPGLDAVSGRITTQGAQFTIPSQSIALTGIDAEIGLNGAQAQINLSGDVATGGALRVEGPVALAPPFDGDLTIVLDDVVLADPGLFQTTLDGQLALTGALASTALLSGQIDLGQTEVRVPSGGGATALGFPVTHVGESSAVRQTLLRAGLEPEPEPQARRSGGGLNYGLDVTVNAPSRIFIRGRGLDAELGGTLEVGGSLQNIQPRGRFELVRGRLNILGQRIELDEATIAPEGDFNPFIRVVAETQSGETQIRVIIEGQVSDPEVTFESTPERPQEEVLSLLLFGRDLSEISALQALRIAGAINTLAGRGPGISETLRANTGLDNLDLQTAQDGTTSVSVGKYIGENAYTDVTVNSGGETEINLNLDITNNITARGTVTSTGNTGVGIYYERDY